MSARPAEGRNIRRLSPRGQVHQALVGAATQEPGDGSRCSRRNVASPPSVTSPLEHIYVYISLSF